MLKSSLPVNRSAPFRWKILITVGKHLLSIGLRILAAANVNMLGHACELERIAAPYDDVCIPACLQ